MLVRRHNILLCKVIVTGWTALIVQYCDQHKSKQSMRKQERKEKNRADFKDKLFVWFEVLILTIRLKNSIYFHFLLW